MEHPFEGAVRPPPSLLLLLFLLILLGFCSCRQFASSFNPPAAAFHLVTSARCLPTMMLAARTMHRRKLIAVGARRKACIDLAAYQRRFQEWRSLAALLHSSSSATLVSIALFPLLYPDYTFCRWRLWGGQKMAAVRLAAAVRGVALIRSVNQPACACAPRNESWRSIRRLERRLVMRCPAWTCTTH